MKLYIDTSNNQKTIVGLDSDRLEKPTDVDKSQQVVSLINEILVKNKKTLKDITEIEVETGPGSFTGLRVGVAVANGLAWSLKIPVNGQEMVKPIYEEDEAQTNLGRNPSEASRRREASLWRSTVAKGEK